MPDEKFLVLFKMHFILILFILQVQINAQQSQPQRLDTRIQSPRFLPFELRRVFPVRTNVDKRPYHNSLLNNTTFLVSASNINPKNFDFSKLHISPKSGHDKPIVPLLWANLPLFDTPSFNTLNHNGQKEKSFFKLPNKEISANGGQTLSSGSQIRSTLVKSDWDGGIETEEKDKNSNISTSESPVVLGRRIPLSNRGMSQFIFSPKTTTTTTERAIILVKLKDHSPAESRTQEAKTSAPLERKKNDVKDKRVGIEGTTTTSAPHYKAHSGSSKVSDSIARYMYEYKIEDQETGRQSHSHSERRQGDTVTGSYSILEETGYTRIVSYVADSSGFRASVKRVKL